MDDLMLHVLDVTMNSISAGATTVKLTIDEQPEHDLLRLRIADNGPGMSAELVRQVLDELVTTKSKSGGYAGLGLGLALLRGTTDLVDGEFRLLSRPGSGTLVECRLPYHHPDRPPLGNVADSLQGLVYGCSAVQLCLTHRLNTRSYRLDTRPVTRELGPAATTRTVRRWLVEQLRESETALRLEG